MKIIEALKKIKDLRIKADDLKDKVKNHSADLDCETPTYSDQKAKIAEWLQAHSDIIKEISSLRYRVQKTNIETNVTIEIGSVHITKTIAEWIHRRKDLAKLEEDMWFNLGWKSASLKEGAVQPTPNSPLVHVKKRFYYDPVTRDTKLSIFKSEPSQIDGALEIANAITDLK